jgi:hypothetical protein
MQESRRKFVKLLGTSAILPAAVPASGYSLWQRADIELERTGQVSGDLTLALLDAQRTRGIFEDPIHFEALRAALARSWTIDDPQLSDFGRC